MLCSGACPVFWKPWAGRVKTSQQSCPRASAEAMGTLLLPHSSYVVLNTTDPPGACGAGNGTNRAPEPLPSDILWHTRSQPSSQIHIHIHSSLLIPLSSNGETGWRQHRAMDARSSSASFSFKSGPWGTFLTQHGHMCKGILNKITTPGIQTRLLTIVRG